MKTFLFNLFVLLLAGQALFAQSTTPADSVNPQPAPAPAKAPEWYKQIAIRGYVQVRYNRLLETNPKLKCEQCDRSWGENGGFFIRRARIIFFGNIHERVYLYIQPDFASAASTDNWHFTQLRDAYFDLALDKKKEFRFRIGQSKVPYGFENMQSSQNRLPLDRNDALNSAVSNERDLGIMFYWAPEKIRKRFSHLVRSGLKGSGDYGVFGFGVYNGQTANRPDMNNSPHYVARLSYPFQLRNGQIFETGIQGYAGEFGVRKNAKTLGPDLVREERVAASFVWYPQPFGIQAEYNIGNGPEFNPATLSVERKPLEGGYAMMMYKIDFRGQTIFPFVRTQYYKGGKKHEIDARRYIVREHEFGIEWQPIENFEFVAMYTISDRTFEDYAVLNNRQQGNLLRLQAQVNF